MTDLESIEARIAAACLRSGRERSTVTLVGASKRQSEERLRAAYHAGLRCYGENRVQEAERHSALLPGDIDWHLIGPLQSNKAARAAAIFSTVHSVDRRKIAAGLDRHAGLLDRRLTVFLAINLGKEESKHGFDPQAILEPATLDSLFALDHLEIRGLMAIPPQAAPTAGADERQTTARSWFRKLGALRQQIAGTHPIGPGLSMGMSGDFEIAIEEGATHVRVGSLLFGQRD